MSLSQTERNSFTDGFNWLRLSAQIHAHHSMVNAGRIISPLSTLKSVLPAAEKKESERNTRQIDTVEFHHHQP